MSDKKKDTENQVFRQKSMDRVNSPEDLNSIIKVANPGVWILIGAIIVLLVGALCWGFLGKMESSITAGVQVKEGVAYVYYKEVEKNPVKVGNEIRFDNYTAKVENIGAKPIQIDRTKLEFDEYLLHVLGLKDGDWVYYVTATTTAKDGAYSGKIITESITPISLIFG